MAVIISTPVRPPVQTYSETTCADKLSRGQLPPRAAAGVDLASNHEFLAGVLGGQRRFHYASRDKRYVVNRPAECDGTGEAHNAAAYEVATVSLGIQAIHQAFAGARAAKPYARFPVVHDRPRGRRACAAEP